MFTKGKWKAHVMPEYTQNYVQSDNGTIIVMNISNGEDAKLIATAPEMYQVLKQWMVYAETNYSGDRMTAVKLTREVLANLNKDEENK